MSAECSRGNEWCTLAAWPGEHVNGCAGDAVDLAGSNGSLEVGWWGWLAQDVGVPTKVVLEGAHQEGVPPVETAGVAAVLAATATPEGRQRLVQLLEQAGVEVPS